MNKIKYPNFFLERAKSMKSVERGNNENEAKDGMAPVNEAIVVILGIVVEKMDEIKEDILENWRYLSKR